MIRNSILSLVAVFLSLSLMGQEISGKSNALKVDFKNVEDSQPVITWVTNKQDVTVLKDKKAYVKVGINSKIKIKNVSLYLNNIAVSNERGLNVVKEEDAVYDEVFERNIVLQEGDNEVKIVAEDIKGNTTVETKIIRLDAPSLITRNDYALLFATDEYNSWGDLVNPVNDAKTLAEELEKFYGFQVEVVTNPTKGQMLGKLREYASKSYLEDDQLFIFIAGHGDFDDLIRQGYLVLKDSRRDDRVHETYLSHAILREIINSIPSKHTLLAIDACFGGTLDPTIARADNRGSDNPYNELSQAEFIQRKLRFKTRRYLTSGGKEYVSDGIPGRHSPFAAKFLEALRSYGGQDKVITMNEIFGYMERIVPEPRQGSFGDNEPGSDFVFVAQ